MRSAIGPACRTLAATLLRIFDLPRPRQAIKEIVPRKHSCAQLAAIAVGIDLALVTDLEGIACPFVQMQVLVQHLLETLGVFDPVVLLSFP